MKNFWLRLSVAAVVVFLGAVPLAQASGFYRFEHGTDYRAGASFAAGVILFLLSMALFGPLTRLVGTVVATLSRVETRPAPMVALGLIVCGTLCVISSLAFAWSGRPVSQSADLGQFMQSMGGNGGGISMNLSTQAGSPGPMLLTVLVFLLGTATIAVGVWAGIQPPQKLAAPSESRAIKAPAPELAEVPS